MRFSYLLLITTALFVAAAFWYALSPSLLLSPAIAQSNRTPSNNLPNLDNGASGLPQMDSLPVENGKVKYISGGISEGGLKAMKAEESGYNLKMTFVAGQEYLANVNVDINDMRNNNVLNATTEGPIMLVNMPPGPYAITARADDGSTLTRKVRVRNRHLSSYILRFPTGK